MPNKPQGKSLFELSPLICLALLLAGVGFILIDMPRLGNWIMGFSVGLWTARAIYICSRKDGTMKDGE